MSDALLIELVDLFHLARTALAGTPQGQSRHAWMVWASDQFVTRYPNYSSTAAYKALDRADTWRSVGKPKRRGKK